MPTIISKDAFNPWSFRGFLTLLLLYCAVHLSLRLLLSDTIGVDEAIEGVFTQKLAAGYDARQPPLYTWILWLVQRVTGPALIGYLLVKYGLLIALFLCYRRIAMRLFADDRYATLAAWSPLLLYQIGWNDHEGVTQTQVLMVACAATLVAFLRVSERNSWIDYGLLGLALGAGFLSKLNFGAFLFCLVAGALWQPHYRSRIVTPRILVALLVAVAVAAPYLHWLATDGVSLTAVLHSAIGGGEPTSLPRIGKGLLDGLLAVLGFLSPLLPILVLLFPRMIRLAPGGPAPADTALEVLLRTMLIAGLALLVLGVLAAGVTDYKERWLHPFLLFAPLYFFARVRRSAPPDGRLRAYVALLIGVTGLVVGLRLATLGIGPPLCNRCRPLVPYAGLAEALAKAGFHDGTIVVRNGNTAGNLRAAFPKARIYVLNNPGYHPPPARPEPGRQCLVVWPLPAANPTFPTDAHRYLGMTAAASRALSPMVVEIPWRHPWRPAGHRVSRWAYVLFATPQGRCR